HHRRGAPTPALGDVGAAGLLAHRGQTGPANDGLPPLVLRPVRHPHLQPLGLAGALRDLGKSEAIGGGHREWFRSDVTAAPAGGQESPELRCGTAFRGLPRRPPSRSPTGWGGGGSAGPAPRWGSSWACAARP